ncbi:MULTISPECIES: SAM-dependent methyltransferase [Catenuloplanes]|uniref:SAM-dependent methyltransferase n=1 Tax=Catenuloplanes niger TaxID=587534 RepID=A0AAE4CXD5_9ACTN|nr:SAM-dependent methyltransferase [Catenuloplanes niger]MDR7328120.1 SAM-dependent methyltransferase [Catenuloplanes niger]
MTEAQPDTTAVSSARVWNYLLGGTDNFPVDREVGDRIRQALPDIVVLAREQRKFLVRVVTYLAADAGVRQFLDIGAGLPTANNTHEIARRITPGARVVYVDRDPLVRAHARALLAGGPPGATDYVHCAAEDPETILRESARTLDLSEPVAVIMCGLLGNIADYDTARAVVVRLMAGLPAGSYLAVSDGVDTSPGIIAAVAAANRSGHPYNLRTPAQVAGYLDGLDPVPPGVVPIPQWRPEPGADPPPMDGRSGLARKP